jgi:hypothetical protein
MRAVGAHLEATTFFCICICILTGWCGDER